MKCQYKNWRDVRSYCIVKFAWVCLCIFKCKKQKGKRDEKVMELCESVSWRLEQRVVLTGGMNGRIGNKEMQVWLENGAWLVPGGHMCGKQADHFFFA